MLIHPTLERLHDLRLPGMAAALEEQLRSPAIEALTFDDRLALLLEREVTHRDDRRLTRLLQLAKLHQSASVEDLDLRTPRGLARSLVLHLSGCEWIRAKQSVLISGATGTGKSYMACPIGQAACRRGLSVRYWRFSRLLGDLALGRADGSYGERLEKLSRTGCSSSMTSGWHRSPTPSDATCWRCWRTATAAARPW
jgi:DNA replication protein DnaC